MRYWLSFWGVPLLVGTAAASAGYGSVCWGAAMPSAGYGGGCSEAPEVSGRPRGFPIQQLCPTPASLLAEAASHRRN